MTGRRILGALALTALVLAAAGATLAIAVRPVAPPPGLRPAPAVTSAPVTSQRFDDERTVPVTLTMSEPVSLQVGRSGKVTRLACAPGAHVESGSSPVSLDEMPLVALHTQVPLYRDLGPGHRGADVESLQTELARLGHDVSADGTFGPATRAAVREIERAAGQPRPDGLLALAEIAWLPATSLLVDSCDAPLGATLAPGDPLASSARALTAISLPLEPQSLAPGERTLTLFDVSAPWPAGREPLTDPELLATVAATDGFAAWAAAPDAPPTARLALTEPLEVSKVPPGAVFGVDGDSACVEDGDTVLPVTIVGSGLGASLVTFDGPAPPLVDLGPALSGASCTGTP